MQPVGFRITRIFITDYAQKLPRHWSNFFLDYMQENYPSLQRNVWNMLQITQGENWAITTWNWWTLEVHRFWPPTPRNLPGHYCMPAAGGPLPFCTMSQIECDQLLRFPRSIPHRHELNGLQLNNFMNCMLPAVISFDYLLLTWDSKYILERHCSGQSSPWHLALSKSEGIYYVSPTHSFTLAFGAVSPQLPAPPLHRLTDCPHESRPKDPSYCKWPGPPFEVAHSLTTAYTMHLCMYGAARGLSSMYKTKWILTRPTLTEDFCFPLDYRLRDS